jgi:hypothetical protein
MDFDKKLIENVLREIQRLNEQLADLDNFADEITEEEKEEIKKETLEQLINNNKILDKMKAGDLKTSTDLEDARKVNLLNNKNEIKLNKIYFYFKKLDEVLLKNYNIKEILNMHSVNQSNLLRNSIKRLASDLYLKKISQNEYDSSICKVLEALEKVSQVE